MKRIIFCMILMLFNILIVNAENKQYVGVQVGFTQPVSRLNLPTNMDVKKLNPTIYNGLKVGLVYDATIVKGFGYTIGLNYTYGGNHTAWKNNNAVSTAQSRYKNQLHLLELIVDWQYKFEIAQDTWLILYSGPTIQCGLSYTESKYERFGPTSPEEFKAKSNLYTNETKYPFKRLNVTWGIGAGFQYERYFLRGGYDFGIINPYQSQTFEGYDVYTRGRFDQWQIKLGVYLWSF